MTFFIFFKVIVYLPTFCFCQFLLWLILVVFLISYHNKGKRNHPILQIIHTHYIFSGLRHIWIGLMSTLPCICDKFLYMPFMEISLLQILTGGIFLCILNHVAPILVCHCSMDTLIHPKKERPYKSCTSSDLPHTVLCFQALRPWCKHDYMKHSMQKIPTIVLFWSTSNQFSASTRKYLWIKHRCPSSLSYFFAVNPYFFAKFF